MAFGCGETTGPGREITRITIAPASISLDAFGDTLSLQATAFAADGTSIPVGSFSWSSSDAAVVTVAGGKVTAKGNGNATITATASGVSGTASVTVAQVLASLAVTPTAVEFAALGDTASVAVQGRDANGNAMSCSPVAWTSSNAAVVTIGSGGLVTSVGNGEATVTAACAGKNASAGITVDQVVASVTATPDSVAFDALGETASLSGSAQDANGNAVAGPSFSWTSSDTGVAKVDSMGLVTAVGNGSALVAANADGVSDTVAVRVQQVPVSLTVQAAQDTLTAIDATSNLSVLAEDANGNPTTCAPVTWESSDTTVVKIDASGTATAVKNGTTSITATCESLGATTPLTVQQQVTTVVVTPGADTLTALGDTLTLDAVGYDANGYAVDGAGFTWSTQVPGVATVNASGVVTAVGAGSTIVSAGASDGGAMGGATILVKQVVASIDLTPASVQLASLGATAVLNTQAKDANANAIACAPVAWASMDEAVVVVDDTGTVTAIDNGSAAVTATCDGVTGSAAVTVSQVVTQIEFVTQPSDMTAGTLMVPAVEVRLLDALGNVADNASDVVTLSIQDDPSGGIATLWGGTVPATNGLARFDSVSVDYAGAGYSLSATATGVSTASDPFDVGSAFHDLGTDASASVLGTVSTCDNCSETLPGTFDQNFYGAWYSAPITVVSNGYLQAATAAVSSQIGVINRILPDTAAPRSIIAVYWDDLSPSVTGDVLWAPYADPDYSGVIVHWRDIQRYDDPGSSVSVEVIFRWRNSGCPVGNEPGCSEMQVVLGPRTLVTTPDASFGIGVQNPTATVGYTVTNNQAGFYHEGLTITLSWDGQNYTRIR